MHHSKQASKGSPTNSLTVNVLGKPYKMKQAGIPGKTSGNWDCSSQGRVIKIFVTKNRPETIVEII